MKKTLLAAALLAGFAGAASAQSSVTLYGIVDVGLSYRSVSQQAVTTLNGGDGATNFGMANGQQSGNRFGLRGVEDIGGGNRVTFQLENGFDLGNGTTGPGSQGGRLFGRQAWLGVESDSWGYVRMGRQVNFASQYVGAIDPFGLSFGTANMGAAFGAANTDRLSNTIAYQTPNMSGFQAGIGYSFANGATADSIETANGIAVASGSTAYNFATANNTRQLSVGARYTNGPFYVAASYDKVFAADALNASADIGSWNLAGSYDFKVVKVVAAYGQTRNGAILGAGAGGTGAQIAPRLGSVENIFAEGVGTNSYIVGAVIPVNPVSRVMLSWAMLSPNTNMKDAYNAQNQSSYNVGYTYDFTKRTNMYAYFSQMQNAGTVDTAKSTTVGLGLRHQF